MPEPHGLVFPCSPRTLDPNRGGLSQLQEVLRLSPPVNRTVVGASPAWGAKKLSLEPEATPTTGSSALAA